MGIPGAVVVALAGGLVKQPTAANVDPLAVAHGRRVKPFAVGIARATRAIFEALTGPRGSRLVAQRERALLFPFAPHRFAR
jgi:hypothetical protein